LGGQTPFPAVGDKQQIELVIFQLQELHAVVGVEGNRQDELHIFFIFAPIFYFLSFHLLPFPFLPFNHVPFFSFIIQLAEFLRVLASYL